MAPPVSGSSPRPNPLSMRDPQPHTDKKPTATTGGVPPPSQYKPKDADTFEEKPVKNGGTFSPTTGLQNVDGSLSPTAQYKDLDSGLREKIDRKTWEALPLGQRSTLIASYQQFKAAGVWQYVDKVVGQKEERERPVKLPGGYQTHVDGNSGGIQYTLKDTKAFTDRLMQDNPQFGKDGGIMGALHPGQTSVRESGPQSTSFHISIGPGNKMDAHIDQVNPVNAPDSHGNTQMNLLKGIQHWAHEVLPEKIRSLYYVPGVVIEPSLKPGSKDDPGAEGKIMIGLEFKGLEKSKPKIVNEQPAGSYNVPDAVIENLAKNPELAKIQFPFPKGLTKDSAPDPKEMAVSIAMLAQEAIEKGDNRIRIDLPSYAGQKGYQSAASGDIGRITKLVLAEMKAQGIDTSGITGVTITYGKKNANDRFATEGTTIGL